MIAPDEQLESLNTVQSPGAFTKHAVLSKTALGSYNLIL